MLSANPLEKFGGLRGMIYDFDFAGEILPSHTHDDNTHHISIVARGRIKAYSDGWEVEATAGQILDFKVGQPHEIAAMEDNTRIINIIKPKEA